MSGMFEFEILDVGSLLMIELLGQEHVSKWLRWDGRNISGAKEAKEQKDQVTHRCQERRKGWLRRESGPSTEAGGK